MEEYITIIGGGLAGSEAAYQIAKRGINVKLYEMKPHNFSPAHNNSNLAEIVCSNSFKSNLIINACGLLKEELRRLDSLLIKIGPNSFHNTIQIRIYSPFANTYSSLLKFQNPADNRNPASPENRTNLAPHIPGFRPAAPHTLPTIIKNPNKKQK